MPEGMIFLLYILIVFIAADIAYRNGYQNGIRDGINIAKFKAHKWRLYH